MWSIEFYETEKGNAPAKEFILSLDAKLRAKAFRSIDLLREFGIAMREPYTKPIGDGLFELRVKFGSDIARVLYFFFVGNRIILTNGFIKKTQKTPTQEIERAKQYMNDFEGRADV